MLTEISQNGNHKNGRGPLIPQELIDEMKGLIVLNSAVGNTGSPIRELMEKRQKLKTEGLSEKEIAAKIGVPDHEEGEPITDSVPDEDEEDTVERAALQFPEIAWRGVFKTYREAMRGTTEAADVHHFAACWSATAVRLRRRVFFQYGLKLYPNVYAVSFGESGDKKTTAARQALELLPAQAKVLSGIGSGEGIAEWLSEETSPYAHFLFLEEYSELLTRAHWDGATIISFLTNIFDCPNSYSQKFKKTPVTLTEPTVGFHTCTTPSLFWQHMREIDFHTGYSNRFIYFTGSVKDPIPLPCRPNIQKLEEVKQALARLDTLSPCEATLSEDAVKLWTAFYRIWRTTDRDVLLKAATERIPAYCLKLAMTYAALENTLPQITKPQLKAAIAVGRYAVKCTEVLLLGRTTATRQGACEQAILRVLEEASEARKALPAWKIHHRTGGRFTAEEVNRALFALERLGHLSSSGGTTKYGKPKYSLSRSRSRSKPFSQ